MGLCPNRLKFDMKKKKIQHCFTFLFATRVWDEMRKVGGGTTDISKNSISLSRMTSIVAYYNCPTILELPLMRHRASKTDLEAYILIFFKPCWRPYLGSWVDIPGLPWSVNHCCSFPRFFLRLLYHLDRVFTSRITNGFELNTYSTVTGHNS